MAHTLVLLRHGQSTWNLDNLFTGWYDADLTDQGRAEAAAAGPTIADAGVLPDVLHTSLQTRAIRTAWLALEAIDRLWIPTRRHWRLNERHYGALQGKDKAQTAAEFGADQLKVWRRSYDTPPPAVDEASEHHPRHDPRYRDVPPELLPATECLKDVLERMLPYWYEAIVPDLQAGRTVLVTAHGNSLRALVKHLDRISDDDITELNLPTGVPILYELDEAFVPTQRKHPLERCLGDAEAIAAAAAAVAAQGSSH
jgi:2,3-bisphosphoglycerate-dependent phosphoglycerate mutase